VSCGGEEIAISFEERILDGNLPSELTFAHGVLKNIRLSSLTYGILSANGRLTYITNEVLTSRHECVFERSPSDLIIP
jgi:hypothetical protein